MKKIVFFMLLVFAGSSLASPLHLDLEMSSEEYRELLKSMSHNKSVTNDDPAIKEALKLGERLSKWIALINSGRTEATAIRLTSPETRRGIPIDKPNVYSPSIIGADTKTILSELPSEIKSVLLSEEALPASLPVNDETFIKHARLIDRNYQSAARYKSVDQFRTYYTDAATRDMRGLYYLESNKITEDGLRDTHLIPAEKVGPLRLALAKICLNNFGNFKRCKKEVESAWKSNTVADFYLRHIDGSKKVWADFFKIPETGRRRDVKWSSTVMTVPFNVPEIPKFGPYLKDNIEDEFRWKNWGIKINFGSYPNGPYLRFEPGVVPHVNDLGGNEIVMDSNQPIEEYESQWTIRHEFGHIIGLPDCYHEFYDVGARAYVNYQLDVTDLMCSRAGDMNERIFKELREAYNR